MAMAAVRDESTQSPENATFQSQIFLSHLFPLYPETQPIGHYNPSHQFSLYYRSPQSLYSELSVLAVGSNKCTICGQQRLFQNGNIWNNEPISSNILEQASLVNIITETNAAMVLTGESLSAMRQGESILDSGSQLEPSTMDPYNAQLLGFVEDEWPIQLARHHAPEPICNQI